MVPPRTFAKPKVKRKPVQAPDDQWLTKVLRACNKVEHRAVLLFLSFGGPRATEAIAVKAKHHDPEAATVLLENTKTGIPRVVPLPDFVNEALCALDHSNPEARLFGFTQRFGLNCMLKRACARAKVPYMSPHKAGRHALPRAS
jgi:integrase